MAGPYLPILSLSRSQRLRIGNAQAGASGAKVPQEIGKDNLADGNSGLSQPFYVDLSDATARRDLQRHGAIGGYIVVGPVTVSNAATVVDYGGVVTAHASALAVDVTAGELQNRLTGVYVAGASVSNHALADTTAASQSVIYLVSWVNSSGALAYTAGVAAVAPVAPATPAGNTPLFTVQFAHAAADLSAATFVDLRPRP